MVLVFLFRTENRQGIESVAIYKIPVKCSLSLQRKLGISCPHKLSFLSKRGKGNTSHASTFFLKNIHWNELFHLNSR